MQQATPTTGTTIIAAVPLGFCKNEMVGWSLTCLFSTNTAISETTVKMKKYEAAEMWL